jgi:HAD superfamily phosphoserine phosphatase-like hydrolase
MTSHEFFRYLMPGIFFYLPLFVIAGTVYLFTGDPSLLHKLKDYAAFITVSSLPTGWVLYQAWRAVWQLGGGGYEPKQFLMRVRDSLKTYRQESLSRTVLDFSRIVSPPIGFLWFTEDEFDTVFDPFKNIKGAFGFHGKRRRLERAAGRRWYLHLVEPVSDLTLFREASYDYARSVASARYGISVSYFALLCGAITATGASFWQLSQSRSSQLVLAIALILAVVAVCWLVVLRRRIANNEHEARVQLITQLNSGDRSVRPSEIESMIDSHVLAWLNDVDSRSHPVEGGPRLAAFDLDGTLIRRDMGDAVLATLISKGRISVEAWWTYQQLLKDSRSKAYEWAVAAMEGLKVADVYLAAADVLRGSPEEKISLSDSVRVDRPSVIPQMQALVMWLHSHDFEVYLVTATNFWAASVVGADFFGIPAERVIGVEADLDRGRLTSRITRPAPIGEGKAEAWKHRLGVRHPFIAAGDSAGDLSLLSLVSGGLILWTGPQDKTPAGKNVIHLDVR